MARGRNRISRLTQQQKELNLYRHINESVLFGPQQTLDADLQRQIDERLAKGEVTRCEPGERTTRAPEARSNRYTPIFTRVNGKI